MHRFGFLIASTTVAMTAHGALAQLPSKRATCAYSRAGVPPIFVGTWQGEAGRQIVITPHSWSTKQNSNVPAVVYNFEAARHAAELQRAEVTCTDLSTKKMSSFVGLNYKTKTLPPDLLTFLQRATAASYPALYAQGYEDAEYLVHVGPMRSLDILIGEGDVEAYDLTLIKPK